MAVLDVVPCVALMGPWPWASRETWPWTTSTTGLPTALGRQTRAITFGTPFLPPPLPARRSDCTAFVHTLTHTNRSGVACVQASVARVRDGTTAGTAAGTGQDTGFVVDRRGDAENLSFQSLYKLDIPRYASVGGTSGPLGACQCTAGLLTAVAFAYASDPVGWRGGERGQTGGRIVGLASDWRLERRREGPGVYVVPRRRFRDDHV